MSDNLIAAIFEASVDEASMFRHLLEKRGVMVKEWFRKGNGWLQKWLDLKPDITIVDLQLPEVDGMHCVQKMRLYKPEALLIFTHSYTGNLANVIEFNAIKVGANTVLDKPFSEARFMAHLDSAMELFVPRKKLQFKKALDLKGVKEAIAKSSGDEGSGA